MHAPNSVSHILGYAAMVAGAVELDPVSAEYTASTRDDAYIVEVRENPRLSELTPALAPFLLATVVPMTSSTLIVPAITHMRVNVSR